MAHKKGLGSSRNGRDSEAKPKPRRRTTTTKKKDDETQ